MNQTLSKHPCVMPHFAEAISGSHDCTDVLKGSDMDIGEQWRPVVGWEGEYEVSDFGRVRSLDRTINGRWGKQFAKGKMLSPSTSPKGYLSVVLCKDGKMVSRPVHRLVLMAFLENPSNKPQVNHKNGIKDDNRLQNLEWATQSENQKHAFANGLNRPQDNRGEKAWNSKLSVDDVLFIRSSKLRGVDLAQMFGVGSPIISQIKSRKRWSWLA